jgi:hypothetical protein
MSSIATDGCIRQRAMATCRGPRRGRSRPGWPPFGADPASVIGDASACCRRPTPSSCRSARSQPAAAAAAASPSASAFARAERGGLSLDRDANVNLAMLDALRSELVEGGPDGVIEIVRLAVRLRPEQLEALARSLKGFVADADAADDPGGEPIGLFVAVHRRR